MNQFTKGVVVVSTLLAAALEVYAAARGFSPILTFCVVGFVLAALVGPWARSLTAGVILGAICVTPAGFLLWAGRDHFTFEMAWMAPLLGLMVTGRGASGWSIPAPWRWPLVTWALVVSVSWPIVVLREFDFAPWILDLPRVSNTSIGISPDTVATLVAYIVLGHNIGLLWIDWLFRSFPRGRITVFRTQVVRPLAAGVLVACGVGAYQGVVNIDFLSGHQWPVEQRAVGTFMDPNVFGTMAALWAPAFAALAFWGTGLAPVVLAAGGLGLSFAGVWVSGSRTGLLAFGIGMAALVLQAWTVWRSRTMPGQGVTRRTPPVAVGMAIVTAIAVLALTLSSADTALNRIWKLGPNEKTPPTIENVTRALWERHGYGSAAVAMVREHPWSGVGVGSFHTLVHDYAVWVSNDGIPPDNAQSWYRHHLAELGVIGSLPWIAWCLMFLRALASKPAASSDLAGARMVRGSLVALGLISLIGMPGQSPAVVITFWTFAFWYLSLLGVPEEPPDPGRAGRSRTLAWSGVLAIVALQAAGTYAAAREDLLPRNRAQRFGWNYRYGIYDLEGTSGRDRGRRWTMKEAVVVIPVEGRVLKFEGWIDHPDGDEHPVDVRVWVNDRQVANTALRRTGRIDLDIPVPEDRKWAIVQTWVSRTWRPADHGASDPRELGLAIADWRWER